MAATVSPSHLCVDTALLFLDQEAEYVQVRSLTTRQGAGKQAKRIQSANKLNVLSSH